MTTSAELRQKIAALKANLVDETAHLERRCRVEVGALEREIKSIAAAEFTQARASIAAILAAHGLTAEDVLASPASRKPAKPSTVEYVGPEGQVWAGRGRHPFWIKDKNFADYARPVAA